MRTKERWERMLPKEKITRSRGMDLGKGIAWAASRLIPGRRAKHSHLPFTLRRSRTWFCVPLVVGLTLPVVLSGCASTVSRRQSPPPILASPPPHPQPGQLGVASWYGPGFHGNPTASGDLYNQYALTAAHPTLPLGTPVEVTNLANGRSVRVRITDRGPFVRGRVIDLSHGAAQRLGMVNAGISRVRIRRLSARQLGDRRSSPSRPQRRLSLRTRRVRPPQPQEPPVRRLVEVRRKDGNAEGTLF
ncbi:MAG TPA: septal ring lytic transglycosylase RlpA family protein [Candidatus Binatia bacterium]|jgi:hypothetical protein|nr:septal ring lytic transglycosylase RlpA family protein [Candidatus Binatia bacterium]